MRSTMKLTVALSIACLVSACGEDHEAPVVVGDKGYAARFDVFWPDDTNQVVLPVAREANLPVVECQINGFNAKMIVDTACGTVCLFDNKLARFGVKVTGKTDSHYTAGGFSDQMAISQFTLEMTSGIKVVVTNAVAIPAYPNSETDGIIGNPILMTLNATLDYGKDTLTLKRPTAPSQAGHPSSAGQTAGGE